MQEFLQFCILGLGLAAVYSLMGSGLVLIYLGSGIVNFAHGTFAMGGAIIYVELRARDVPVLPAIVISTLAGMLAGVIVQNVIMRRLRHAAPLARIIATLGLFVALLAGAAIHYGDSLVPAKQYLPQHTWTIGGIEIASDRLILFLISVLVAALLTLFNRKALMGVATVAAAENEQAAAILGWSPNGLATLNWALATGLATLAGALVVPLSGLLVGNLALLIMPALAAALVGRFTSFGLTLLGATGIGVTQSLISHYWDQPGGADGVPFILIILLMVLTGRSLPVRAYVHDKLPRVGSGRIRPVVVLISVVVSIVLMTAVFDQKWQSAFTVSLAFGLLMLSLVVLLGYAGQISLAQGAIAGLGAYIAGRLVAVTGIPFWLAFVVALFGAIPIGIAFSIPALRTRGVNLAVVTLGLGIAIHAMLFSNPKYTGDIAGTVIGNTSLFGWDIDSIHHPGRWGFFVLVLFILCALAVANLRRSGTGRRMIAIRENERAAASLGVSVVNTKAQAFAIAAGIATVAGIAMTFGSQSILYENFQPLLSITAAAFTVIGGAGYVIGPLLGGSLATGGIGSLLDGLLHGIDGYLSLIGGIGVVIVLLQNPNGMVEGLQHQARWVGRLFRRPSAPSTEPPANSTARRLWARLVGQTHPVEIAPAGHSIRTDAKTLSVVDLSVHFGGTIALDHASLEVVPGTIVGLIGPNGAGKTTLIDAVTGFVRADGQLRLGDTDVARLPAHRRVAAGIARSWQSLELFEDVSVLENLQVASEQVTHRWWNVFSAIVRPGRPRLGSAASAAVEVFELEADLHRMPTDLPYGRRRLVGIARAAALSPGILLLDEPAAGLSSSESQELGVLITRLSKDWGMGILLVEHDVNLVMSICDTVTVLNFGKVIASGPPAEVRTNPDVIAAYLGQPEDGSDIAEPALDAIDSPTEAVR